MAVSDSIASLVSRPRGRECVWPGMLLGVMAYFGMPALQYGTGLSTLWRLRALGRPVAMKIPFHGDHPYCQRDPAQLCLAADDPGRDFVHPRATSLAGSGFLAGLFLRSTTINSYRQVVVQGAAPRGAHHPDDDP